VGGEQRIPFGNDNKNRNGNSNGINGDRNRRECHGTALPCEAR